MVCAACANIDMDDRDNTRIETDSFGPVGVPDD
jgi:hypothetical protein